jgi:hypothetical protein
VCVCVYLCVCLCVFVFVCERARAQVFRSLLSGESRVAVERPETIQYFNNMVEIEIEIDR